MAGVELRINDCASYSLQFRIEFAEEALKTAQSIPAIKRNATNSVSDVSKTNSH